MISRLPLISAVLAASFVSHLAFASIKIEVTPKPNPPESGENSLTIRLRDDTGKAVDTAKVDVTIFMPSMGTMPRMDEKALVEPQGKGAYLAKFDLAMGGTWELTVSAEFEGAKTSAHYSLTTGVAGVSSRGGSNTGAESSAAQALDIGPERLQKIGVRFVEAKTLPMKRDIEAVGVVEQDQTHREELSLRYSGYVVKQFRGRIGDSVQKGDPLFTVYSPDLVTAQSELLLADKISEDGHSLHDAASEKLKNLGLSSIDIDQIRKTHKPIRDIIIRSPLNGTILDITAREGASVNAGQLLYSIGDLNKTYLVARVFQQDIGDVRVGQTALISVPGAGTEPIKGKVNLIYPQVEQGAGTVNVRLEVMELKMGLKPGVYMDVAIPVELGNQLTIPSEAVLYSGRHRYVFVDRGEGQLEPREVSVGKSIRGSVQVYSGLSEGERVAASGTFLLGSEAQLRSALPKWSDVKSSKDKGKSSSPDKSMQVKPARAHE
ncbi:MAG: FixH family protein [Oligoflexus sp.]|nr:FixH family protein [Oligoflexus sp.]